jgi:hypothetical protein
MKQRGRRSAAAVASLATRHFWAGVELRILAHGSTFFCGWSGIAFKVDWYS